MQSIAKIGIQKLMVSSLAWIKSTFAAVRWSFIADRKLYKIHIHTLTLTCLFIYVYTFVVSYIPFTDANIWQRDIHCIWRIPMVFRI